MRGHRDRLLIRVRNTFPYYNCRCLDGVFAAMQHDFINTGKFAQNPLKNKNGHIIPMGLEVAWALL